MDMQDYKWTLSPNAQKFIQEIDILKYVFVKLPLPESQIKIIRQKALINSAVSSAQIENIPSTIENPRREGKNLEFAYQWIHSNRISEPLSPLIIRNLHKQVMTGLSGSAGQLRQEPWGVFSQAGLLIHNAPLHTLLPQLILDLSTHINKLTDHPAVIAAIAQFIFEKIHPFADGNGRTGRLISAYLLHRSGYGLGGLVPLEKYINDHRDWYYRGLEPSHNCTEFVEFFLEGLVTQANVTLDELKNPPSDTPSNKLLPRRRELLETIKDHPECSFDFLHRRFININPRALHRDLQHLQNAGFIEKLGSTRGAVYVAKI